MSVMRELDRGFPLVGTPFIRCGYHGTVFTPRFPVSLVTACSSR